MSNSTNGATVTADSPKGWVTYRRLLAYVKPYWPAFLLSMLGFAVVAGSQAAFAKLMKHLVDELASPTPNAHWLFAGTIMGVFVVRGLGSFVGSYGIAYVSRSVVHSLRCDIFDTLMRLPSQYFHAHTTGHLLAKVTYNVDQVTGAATGALKTVVREGLTVVGLMGYLVFLNWRLALVFFTVSPLIAWGVRTASKRFRRLSRNIQNSMGDVTHTASEALQGYQVVRIFGGMEYERRRFEKASRRNQQQGMKLVATEAISTPVIQFFVALAMAMLVFMALNPAWNKSMTSGDFISFLTAAGLIVQPLRALAEINNTLQKGIAAAESIFSVVDEPIEIDKGSYQADRVRGHVQIRDLEFQYNTGGQVLKGISVDIKPGETVALVGRSGSGKSTLASLIPRFYDVAPGQILIDGVDINDYQLDNLRQHIALVNQQVVLFAGSLKENIAYAGLGERSDEQIQQAAEAAHVLEFAERMPEGMNTLIGEKGVLLSGGQRQRLAIARAVLKDAPILILDEATSALDTESERHIQAAMEAVMKGRTTLVIAHRLSTIEKADRILVMEQGQIVEQGSHAELLARNGAYAKLHQMQFNESHEQAADVSVDAVPKELS